MDENQRAVVRYLFQHVLSSQDVEVHNWLWDRFLDDTGDMEWAQEYMNAYKALEGWVASHGLENK